MLHAKACISMAIPDLKYFIEHQQLCYSVYSITASTETTECMLIISTRVDAISEARASPVVFG